MTTNAGSDKTSSVLGFSEKEENRASEKTEKALFGFLRPEFINRIDEIITFNHLTKDDFVAIADIMLSKLGGAMDERGIRLTYTPDVLQYVADNSFSEKYGARNMRRFIEREIEDPIANTVIEKYPDKILGIHLGVSDGKVEIKSI